MIGIGIIGLGTVGAGTYRILTEHAALIRKRTGVDIGVVRVAEVDPRKIKGKGLARGTVTSDAMELIRDERVDIVVELIGGVHPASDFIIAALNLGKQVVTANKALLSERGADLFGLAARKGCEIGFEASVCGGIPVIRAIRDGLVGNDLTYILGILNGTSNYILSRMTEEGISFAEALKDAQQKGYAEKDPTFDVEGIDAAHKLSLLVRLAFASPITMDRITTRGISSIDPVDIGFARDFGYKIKLLAIAKKLGTGIEARVEPAMLPVNHPMSSVNGVYNAVYIVGDMVGPNLFYGKGAGSEPTGSAVVSDIVDIAKRIFDGGSLKCPRGLTVAGRFKEGKASPVPYYLRVMAQDRPGVLSKISGILSEYRISISAVTQRGRKLSGYVPVVMVTHDASEEGLGKAKREIDGLSFTKGESVHIRIEEGNL
ncbi:MAG: homoserine dehydrogenase [Syntrophorhabdaceae bacterium]|nr:homoserine dehydrogenase [Syntrophorhabdaceae bacterium]